MSWYRQRYRYISIRAPARGATLDRQIRGLIEYISIRAPARGATGVAVRYGIRWLFQSALPRGERLVATVYKTMQYDISIRAPARGATTLRDDFISALKISIRAPARGATVVDNDGDVKKIFQSALPRGERLSSKYCCRATIRFQSALPRGERL